MTRSIYVSSYLEIAQRRFDHFDASVNGKALEDDQVLVDEQQLVRYPRILAPRQHTAALDYRDRRAGVVESAGAQL